MSVSGVVGNLAAGTYYVGVCDANASSNAFFGLGHGALLQVQTPSGTFASTKRTGSQKQ